MISVMIEFAMFFLVVFFVLPSIFIFLMTMREYRIQVRKPAPWQKVVSAELAN